ncbi:hypothetical protein EIN_424290 [Entamoeba invadens IP1]|uniref:Rab-GAP TBC domain-containing protein n=1 Tax=Entamoeba invadens IP1 TaxID=370355 RepID=A0A0A1U5U5_ENTIV|nr:hypothetical protein EIN_424290 [Entamoeba invadens IP1]ELP89747.1 hypothetical protein EIN_424290 [Entamoeba invadens IP1]|eukprot:XP_004256518.1 hypothetical protein EIN_424290 [Entamoeba invadens IP1]
MKKSSKDPTSPRTTKKEILEIGSVCVQNEEKAFINGTFFVCLEKDVLSFCFQSKSSLDGKSKHKQIFKISFDINEVNTISIYTPVKNYETLLFQTETHRLPSFFFPIHADLGASNLLNTIIENGFTVVPKDNNPNVYLVHKRFGRMDQSLARSDMDISEITSLDTETVKSYANKDGSYSKESEEDIRKSVYVSGIKDESRVFIWKLVLNYYTFSMTERERDEVDQKRNLMYYRIRSQWQNFTEEQLKNWDEMKRTLDQIDKDVARTDNTHPKFLKAENVEKLRNVLRTYALYNNRVLYGQGLNDLCSLIMEVTLEESEIFWLLKLVMDIMEKFYVHQSPKKSNFDEVGKIIGFINPALFDYFKRCGVDYSFCFRWIVLLFKRDFETKLCLQVWDRIFAYPERNLYYFVASSIILEHADQIVSQQRAFDGMVDFLQKLHKKIPAEVVFHSDIIYQQFNKLAVK